MTLNWIALLEFGCLDTFTLSTVCNLSLVLKHLSLLQQRSSPELQAANLNGLFLSILWAVLKTERGLFIHCTWLEELFSKISLLFLAELCVLKGNGVNWLDCSFGIWELLNFSVRFSHPLQCVQLDVYHPVGMWKSLDSHSSLSLSYHLLMHHAVWQFPQLSKQIWLMVCLPQINHEWWTKKKH